MIKNISLMVELWPFHILKLDLIAIHMVLLLNNHQDICFLNANQVKKEDQNAQETHLSLNFINHTHTLDNA